MSSEINEAVLDLDVEIKTLVQRIMDQEAAGDPTPVAVALALLKTITSMAVEGMALTTALAQTVHEFTFNGRVPRAELLSADKRLAAANVRTNLLGYVGPQIAQAGLVVSEETNAPDNVARLYQITVYVLNPAIGPQLMQIKRQFENAEKAKAERSTAVPPQG